MKKEDYKRIQDIKERLRKNEPTTFAERNVVNIYETRIRKKQKKA